MKRSYQKGGVSVFIVIFTALLLTTITTSFVQLMVRNEQQASTNDLSQSAYDAALAGVEDAKRALVRLTECGEEDTSACNNLRNAFRDHSDECEFLGSSSVNVTRFIDGEVVVGNPELSQAYTCVKIQLESQDVTGKLEANSGAKVIRLKAVNNRPIDKVRISWFSPKDVEDADGDESSPYYPLEVEPEPINGQPSIPSTGGWAERTPSILRAQLIQFNRSKSIQLDDFSSQGTNNALTAFLYPNVQIADRLPGSLPGDSSFWDNDARLRGDNTVNSPSPVECDPDNTEYYCSVTLTLPNPEDGGRSSNREAYLQLAALYNATHYKVELLQGNNVVLFDSQQAIVDSTGRASSLFRRVNARVSVKTPELNFPDAALSVEGDLCKNFTVTSREADYSSECPPAAP